MFYVLQNESTASLRRIPILLTDAATGTTAMAGVNTASIYPYVAINGGAFIGGTGPVYESGFGQYVYQMHPAETATLGLAGIHITAPACRDYDAIAQIAAFNVYSASVGATAGDIWSYDISALTSPSAGFDLTQAAAGGGVTAYDVWSFDYNSAGVVAGSAAERLEETRTEAYAASNNTVDIGNQVWNRDPLSIGDPTTGDKYSAYLYQLGTGATGYAGTALIAGDVWNYDISAISTAGLAGKQLNDAAAGGGITAGGVADAVWNSLTSSYTTSGTFGLNTLRSDVAGIAGTVTLWTGGAYSGIYADAYRIDESYVAATALKDILTGIGSSITSNITGNITGDLSGSVGSVTADVNVSTASMTGIAGTVWNTDVSSFTSPSAGYDLTQAAAGGGVTAYAIAQEVWNTDVSAFTSPSAGFDLANASAGGGITAGGVADAVWTAQVATYATAGSNETLGTDTYGQKIARTVTINRPLAINTANAVVVGSMSNGAITATAIASNAITEAKFATDALTSRVIAADAITSAELAPSANTEIADAVWAYATRNITGGTITTNNDKTGYSLSGSQTFDVTGNITGNLSGSVGSVTTVSSGAISAASFLAGSIDAAAVANDAVVEIAGGVWSYGSGRTITGGTITTVSDKTGYSLSSTQSFNLTGNITGNLSGSVGSVSGAVGSVTGAVGSVTGAVGSVTGAVGSVTSPVSISTTSMSGIAGTVWNTDISSFTNPSAGYSLAVAGSGGVSAADVWNYNGGRTITGGGTTAYDVWNFDPTAMTVPQAGAILTDIASDTNSIQTDISNIPNNVWVSDVSGYTNPGEAGFELTQAASGAGLTVGDVWSYNGGRTITGGTATTVTNPVSVTTASMSGIAGTVWNTNISAITTAGTAGKKLNDASTGASVVTIVNGPYTLNSTAEGTDGRIDILQDSVQTIELMLVNAFGSPINIAGNYTVSVDIYDEASALVHSYSPTINYALGGILSFDLDTLVTANIGRYSIVVSLTDGDVIQVGPLQILVRPL